MPVVVNEFEVVPASEPRVGSTAPPRPLEAEVERIERLLAERAERLRAD